jgi:quercetin dioxygenase-like cupin family protein
MQIIRSRAGQVPSERRTATFSGDVWIDGVLQAAGGAAGAASVAVNNVFFAPGSRTYWHSHEHGQVIQVASGAGLICAQDEHAQAISAGDTVWTEPGVAHWHGGGPQTFMLHLATSLGTTTWLGPVDDAQYAANGGVQGEVRADRDG